MLLYWKLNKKTELANFWTTDQRSTKQDIHIHDYSNTYLDNRIIIMGFAKHSYGNKIQTLKL